MARHVAHAEALAAEGAGEVTRLRALRTTAFADFDVAVATNDPAIERRAEATWAEARAARAHAEARYRDATIALEPALLLDSRPAFRRRMAELLLALVELATLDHDAAAVAELTARIAPYDPSRVPVAAATGTLVIEVTPAAQVTVRCAEPGAPHRLGPPRMVATGARHVLAVPATLCTVGAVAPDHVAVTEATVVPAERWHTVRLTLPPASAPPPDFVFVPAGWFLYGAADPESVRQSIAAPPEHPVFQRAFWIARHETTFAAWIEYLDALPPGERDERRPMASGPTTMSLQLVDTPTGAWSLELADGTTTRRHARGEPVVYPGRTLRRAQAWERWPVVGVRVADARAYAAWLDHTGRVPGARLCTNAEWERAARGADDRLYPHGDELAPDDANWIKTYDEKAGALGLDEVGSHPASDSPFGVADLAGNAWEFVDAPPDLALTRGGGWYYGARAVRASNLVGSEPRFRDTATGVRVCADPR